MTKAECTKLLSWLSATWPRAYPPAMKDERRLVTLENIEAVFGSIPYEEVKDAFVYALKTQDDVPTFAEIRNRCLGNRKAAQQAQMDAVNLDGLPDYHPWRGCFVHAEAYDKCVADIRSGVKGASNNFSAYCKRYPSKVWRPWANHALNKDNWPYITRDNFAGWKDDENGFCVPYTK